jgi:predicted helicase
MPTDHRAKLATIRRFDQLVAYLRDEMGWPIARDSFEDVDDLFYDFTADELGIDPKTAAKIESIKRLRPLSPRQPWGIFFVKFEPKRLPVVALRRILSQVALKKRASANSAERAAWAADDLLFVSNYGEGDERQITFAHFSKAADGHDLPTLKVLGWDNLDTALHLDAVAKELTQHLAWPDNDADVEAWRQRWRSAFTLRHREVITTSRELSIHLAELARAIRDRIKSALAIETQRGPLTKLMKAFQEALVHDLDADGFADMYAQTIAYGLLSARIADPHKKTADDFAGHMRTNPFLRELMETFLRVGGRRGKAGGPGIDFDELGVSEVVELLDDANMEAIVRDFGDRNPQEDPVIHFYELFLKEYDAKKRMQRGVFYTPRPVVSYIVRSVDEILRSEFGLEDGLADTATWDEMAKRHRDLKIPEGTSPDQAFVQVLDPATGTGTFLVEVIDLIYKTLHAKWQKQGHVEVKFEALWNDYVPKHLLPRLHGYEILMAPYAIAHLKISLKLYETGYRFGSDERARIYLTNALEPAFDFSGRFEFAIPALAHEAQAVDKIKRNQRFTVVVGNPPYSSLSQNMGEWIKALVKPFRAIRGVQIEEKGKRNHLQDDYVKFVRLALLQLEMAGAGVIGLITNHSYLYSPTFRAMRYYILEHMSGGRILDLSGNAKRDDAKRYPGDENVFDIQQGVAISVLWLSGPQHAKAVLYYGALFGSRADKTVAVSEAMPAGVFQGIYPAPEYYIFESSDVSRPPEYEHWLKLDEAMPFGGTGVKTNRDDFVIDFEDDPIVHRMQVFRDPKLSDSQVQELLNLGENYTWKISKQRRLFRTDVGRNRLRDIEYRPFDKRRIYYQRHVVYNPRFETMGQAGADNVFLLLCRQQYETGFRHAFVTRRMFECCVVSAKSREITSGFPLYLSDQDEGGGAGFHPSARHVNFSSAFREGLKAAVGLEVLEERETLGRKGHVLASEVLSYVYGILHSPEYRRRYAESLKIDFPRIPLPDRLDLFGDLGRLGGELVSLHLMESPKLGDVITAYTGPKNPEVGRVGWSNDIVWLDAAATKRGQPATPGTIGFRGVPEAVWNFHIGGYQVCEKWLKDRKGRKLSKDDLAHYQKIVVAINETIRLMKEIDDVIDSHGGWPGAFGQGNEYPEQTQEDLAMVAEPPDDYGRLG